MKKQDNIVYSIRIISASIYGSPRYGTPARCRRCWIIILPWINSISIDRIRDAIDSIRSSMRRVFEESFGIVQWLGKKSNQDKLARLPEIMQRDLNVHLDAIYATIIINSERLKEILGRQTEESQG